MNSCFRIILISCFFIIYCRCILFAQQQPYDSLAVLDEVEVHAFGQQTKLRTSNIAMQTLGVAALNRDNKISLVNSFNTIAGVKMEERSPGSYRINIRGSSLRSPFGVRNVKVYWNDIPVTDPGGNTYFNQFAFNNFNDVEIYKGPASGMYGAGTGGLIMLNTPFKQQEIKAAYTAGSYGSHLTSGVAGWYNNNQNGQVAFSHQQGNGYRIQSHMKRNNFSYAGSIKINDQQTIYTNLLLNDLYYQTPGGLTLAEYKANARQARPASGTFPSAVEAKAAIWQKNFLLGITHQYFINNRFNLKTTVYGALAQVKNSAIRNFEQRHEPHFGGRTTLSYEKKFESGGLLQWLFGAEYQHGIFSTKVSNNVAGAPGVLQTNDAIKINGLSVFAQVVYAITNSWIFTGGLSENKSSLAFTRLTNEPATVQKFSYDNELAPRISIIKKIKNDLSLIATVSKGFSPPTVAELLPSTGILTALKAEHGWNYELTARQFLWRGRLHLEATGFYFNLEDGLVQRRDAAGADYFTNAGRIKEKGAELLAQYIYVASKKSIFNYLNYRAALTFSHFRYGNFVNAQGDFSGKVVPGIPANNASLSADVYLKKGFYTNISYYASQKIFLNDANTATANPYHLLGCKAGYKNQYRKWKYDFFAGADNLLNQTYSLGNDINAAAGRYYNAAPKRNYYAGLVLGL